MVVEVEVVVPVLVVEREVAVEEGEPVAELAPAVPITGG